MGSLILTLLLGGVVYIDASCFIYTMERIEPYRSLLEPMWQYAQDGNISIVSGHILVTETLVKPIRDANPDIEAQYRAMFESGAVRLLDAPYSVFDDAARIRAETRLKTPDALHAATALSVGCTLFITNDRDFRRVPNLPVVILDDLL